MRYYRFYSFSWMGIIAAVFFILIVIINTVINGANSAVEFIEKYYVIIGIILFVIITAVSFWLILDTSLPIGFKIANFFGAEAAFIQSGVFLVYGLYRTLQMYPNNAFMIVGCFGAFVLIFAIDLAVTISAVTLTMEKPWGFALMILVALIGLRIAIG